MLYKEKSKLLENEKNRNGLEKLDKRNSELENTIKVLNQKHFVLKSELNKKEKEIDLLKEEIKKLKNPIMSNQKLELFDGFVISKGINTTYNLQKNINNNNCKLNKKLPIDILNSAFTDDLNKKINEIDNKLIFNNVLVYKIDEIIYNEYLLIFNDLKSKLIDSNMFINNYYEVQYSKNNNKQELNWLDILSYDQNDYEYDLFNKREENIIQTFKNNINKISFMFKILIQYYKLKSLNIGEDYVNNLLEIINQYKIFTKDINWLLECNAINVSYNSDSNIESQSDRFNELLNNVKKLEDLNVKAYLNNKNLIDIKENDITGINLNEKINSYSNIVISSSSIDSTKDCFKDEKKYIDEDINNNLFLFKQYIQTIMDYKFFK